MTIDTEACAWRIVDGQAILLDRQTSEYITLNETATLLWEYLAGSPRRTPELTVFLAERYSLDSATAARDVQEFLEACVNRGFIRET